jgi:hypothetical protein
LSNLRLPDGARCLSDWATVQARRQLRLQGHLLEAAVRPGHEQAASVQRELGDVMSHLLALPFDLIRAQHALAVQTGMWPRSLLESQRFESQLDAAERLTLGPLARSI